MSFKPTPVPQQSSLFGQANGVSCSFQPRALNYEDKKVLETCDVFSGSVVTILEPKKIGFIRCKNLPAQYATAKKDVFFHFSNVRNIGISTINIGRGSDVDFVLEENAEVPRAYLVFVDGKSEGAADEGILSKNRASRIHVGWLLGEVVSIDDGNVFLRSEGNRVFMHSDKISRFALPLKIGDTLAFIANDRDPNRPSVLTVKHHGFAGRSKQELREYFKRLRKVLPSSECHRVMLDITSLDAQWLFLMSSQLLEDDGYSRDLLRLLIAMMDDGKETHLKQLTPIISQAVRGHVLEKLLQKATNSTSEIIKEFSLGVITHFPELASNLHLTADLWSAQELCDLYKSSLRALGKQSGAFNFDDWRSMPSIPTASELLSDMISEDMHLTTVRTKQGYKTTDEYMDTYFRLFRAEAFNAIQKGIKDFRSGAFDQRDMNVYARVFLAGLEITDFNVSIGLRFKPVRKVPDWGKSQALMFGNLVCITPGQKFDDVIWATVNTRDNELLNKSNIIFVQLCDFNQFSLSEILDKLLTFGGNTIMVESPTYFQAINPVLTSLRKIELERFLVKDEIVHVTSTDAIPGYFEDSEEIDEDESSTSDDSDEADSETSVECLTSRYGPGSPLRRFLATRDLANIRERANVRGAAQRLAIPNSTKPNVPDTKEFRRAAMELAKLNEGHGLDEAQQAAFEHALVNRVAIIQGPPGTGKTFIGIKLAKTILKYDLCSPILVLTYKNHALDEFLKHTLEFCSKGEIARIGRRSKEPELNECNLHELVKGERIHGNFSDVRIMTGNLRRESFKLLKEVYDKSCFSEEMFLRNLTEGQLKSLIVDADWSINVGTTYKVNMKNRHYVTSSLIPQVVNKYGSLNELIALWAEEKVPQDDKKANHCIELVLLLLRRWMPKKTFLHQIKQMYEQFVFENEEVVDAAKEQAKDDSKDGDSDVDEDYITEVTNARKSALGVINSEDSKLKWDQILLLEMDAIKESIFSIFDFPKGMQSSPAILAVPNLWKLTEIQKAQFLYSTLLHCKQGDTDKLETAIEDLQMFLDERKEMEVQKQLDVLKNKKIIGMTITGASIHHELIALLRPRVVIVEEAAEILEPSLIAALNPHVQHLILIGDHKQLRPKVETYELVQKFKFDVSMMERLISSGFPYKVLQMQNRMRPEFAALLKDIYPDLKDNLERIRGNKRLGCMRKSMFFWHHSLMEDGGKKEEKESTGNRSKKNTKEAEMVTAIVRFLLLNGCKPSQITVLAAYLGQRMELSKKIRPLCSDSDEYVQVQTIDTYQGDENDIVIVSLVRSNEEGSIGFLNTLNRRCVAQSRAKCGMYFVGNVNTLTSIRKSKNSDSVGKSVWTGMINSMKDQGCVGPTMEIQCRKHKQLSRHGVTSTDDLMFFVDNPEELCKMECGVLFPCKLREHACKKPCSPMHLHTACQVQVKDIFEACGHEITRICHEDIKKIQCKVRVSFEFKKCRHPGHRQCYVRESTLRCESNCVRMMSCELHSCPAVCGAPHNHRSCQAEVSFVHSTCGHTGIKKCSQDGATVHCDELVTATLPACKHEMQKPCHQPIADVKCTHKCALTMTCGLHPCPRVCGDVHKHDNCKEKVQYCFPTCGHPSKYRKECSEPIKWQCEQLAMATCSYGHEYPKKCCSKPNDNLCQFVPCPKQDRQCTHPCTNKCGEDCSVGNCSECDKVTEEKMRQFREQAKRRKLELKEMLRNAPKSDEKYLKMEIFDFGETKAEYRKVEDQVQKFTQPMHNWVPVVTNIVKVTNLELAVKFEEAKSTACGDFIDWKFHGTSDFGIDGICQSGFRPPAAPKQGKRPGMFGQGIYFATDSSKSAQFMYTKGSNKLLLCKVLLGRSMEVRRADNTLNLEKLRSAGYDSVFAPRGSEVMNDEFVIFDPRQALPEYIIHYTSEDKISSSIASSQDFERIKLTFSRKVDMDNPRDKYYRFACGHYVTQSDAQGNARKDISYVEMVVNKRLETAFQAKKSEFKAKKIPFNEVLAFHGTDSTNIDNILRTNLDPSRSATHGRVHGHGCYFSEFPEISHGYGNGLILFRVLPGNEYSGASRVIPHGYQSKKVNGNDEGFGQMLIITDPAQFLPYFVYHFN